MLNMGILDNVGVSLPSMSGVGSMLILIFGLILVAILVLLATVWITKRMLFNKKIVVFKMVNGKNIPVAQDKGMLQRVGMAGDYWMVTKKFKKILPFPRIEMAKNVFWFFQREDGEWINFSLKDFDAQMKKAGANYLDSDMGLSRVAIEKNLKDRFQQETFWQKYGNTIMQILFAVILMVCVVVVMTKMASLMEMMTTFGNQFLAKANNVCQNSGVI